MAFKLKDATRVLMNVSRQVCGRVFTGNPQQHLHHSQNNWNKLYCFRGICSSRDLSMIQQVEDTGISQIDPSITKMKDDLTLNFNRLTAIKVISSLHSQGTHSGDELTHAVVSFLLGSSNDGKEEVELVSRGKETTIFLRRLVEHKLPIKSQTYTKLLQYLSAHEMNKEFLLFVKFMRANGVEPDVHQSSEILKMASRVGNVKLAQLCFDKIDNEKFTVKKDSYYNIISAHYKEGSKNDYENENDYNMVHYYYNKMIEAGHEPTTEVLELLCKSYVRSGDIEGANSVVEKWGQEDMEHFEHLIKYEQAKVAINKCVQSGDSEGINKVVEKSGDMKESLEQFIEHNNIYKKTDESIARGDRPRKTKQEIINEKKMSPRRKAAAFKVNMYRDTGRRRPSFIYH